MTSESSPGRFSCGGSTSQIYIYGQNTSATASTIKVKGFNWGGSYAFIPPIPAGNWTLKYNGETVGIFDLESASIVTGGVAKVYIPSVRTTASGSNITKIELRFLLYSPSTGSYEVITDLTTFKKVVTSLFIDLDNYSSRRKSEHIQIDVNSADSNGVYTVDSSKFSGTWSTSEFTTAGGASLATGYEIFGYAMRTEYRNQ